MNKSRIYAITDIGSNTVKCSVYKITKTENTRRNIENIDFMTKKLGLIARVEHGSLTNDAISLLCDTISNYKKRAEELGANSFNAFGTAVMRKIDNFDAVNNKISEMTGTHVHLILGDDEAKLSFKGSKMLTPEHSKGIMADMGGGSTELIAFTQDDIHALHSFPFGCLSIYKIFVKGRFPTPDEAQNIHRYVTEEISKYDFTSPHENLILIGGTGKAIKKVLSELGYSPISNPIEVLQDLALRFAMPTDKDIAMLENLVPSRVETVIPGLLAYIAIAERANAKNFAVSTGGIREGYLERLISEDGF